jgi:oligo-1,6-glucosidase
MQWNNGFNAGFSTGEKEPWIMINPNYREINAEEQTRRAGSVFHYYKKLIQLRKTMGIIPPGDFQLLLPNHPDIFAYIREYQQEKLLVVCNFTDKEVRFVFPEGFNIKNILITNDDTLKISAATKDNIMLGAFGAVVYQ